MKVFLRSLELDDYKTSVVWRNDPRVTDLLGGARHFVSEELERKWVSDRVLQNSADITLAVCLSDTEQYVGNVYLKAIDWINRSAESAILLGEPSSWGKGLGEAALWQLLRFAFDDRGLERIFAYVLADNERSLRLHEKCGYQREGTLRRAVYKGGRFHDQYLLSILSDEYRSAAPEDPSD